jgi:hypothetical protein
MIVVRVGKHVLGPRMRSSSDEVIRESCEYSLTSED